MNKNKLDPVIKDIQYYFKFLFDMGFKISSIRELSMGDWQVILDSLDISIMICSDQGEINLLFSPIDNRDTKNLIDIRTMIYYLSSGKNFIGKYEKYIFNNRKRRFERLSTLLKEYLDQITPYFGKNFEKYKHELIRARQKCGDIFVDRYVRKRRIDD